MRASASTIQATGITATWMCGPHGADPDEMPGVIRLATGHYDDGRLVAGPAAHSDVINEPCDAWRNILAVITGDRTQIRLAG